MDRKDGVLTRLQGGLDEVTFELRSKGEGVSCGNFWEEQSRQRERHMQRPWGRTVRGWGSVGGTAEGLCSWNSE